MALTETHWKNVVDFLQRKAAERKLTDTNHLVEMIPEFWDELSDEAGMQKAADEGKLADIEKTIADEDARRPNLETEKEALETKLGKKKGR